MGRTSDAKERLINTAVGMLRAASYNSVSVDDLCQAAQVRKGSFYHFFPSKRDLALAAVDAWWNVISTELLEPCFRPDLPPRERIRRFFEAAATAQARTKATAGRVLGCTIGNLSMELSAQDEVMREKVQEAFSRFAGYFQAAIEDGMACGDVPPDANAPELAQALLAYLYGAILLAKTGNDPEMIARLGRHATELLPLPVHH